MLLDIKMPRQDGATVAQKLRQDPRMRQIPVVFLTGLIRTEEASRRGGRIRANLHLPKPFDAQQLLRIVEQATLSGSQDAQGRR